MLANGTPALDMIMTTASVPKLAAYSTSLLRTKASYLALWRRTSHYSTSFSCATWVVCANLRINASPAAPSLACLLSVSTAANTSDLVATLPPGCLLPLAYGVPSMHSH